MANVLKDTIKNIPPKARFVLGLSCIIAASIIFIFMKSYGGPGDSLSNLPSGATLVDAPSSSKIEKTIAGDEITLPEGSPIAVAVEKEKEEIIQKAKDNYGNAFERIVLKNKKDIEIKKEIENRPTTIPNALKDTNVFDKQILEERERLRNKDSKTPSPSVQGTYSLFSEDEFMLKELSLSDNLSGSYSKLSHIPSSGLSGSSKGSASNSNSQNSNVNTSKNSSAKSKVQSYVRNSNDMPRVNSKQINQNRGLSNSNSVSAYNSIANEEKINSSYFNSGQSNYASMVNPLNRTQEKSTEIINLGEMHYGILQIGVNTDEIGPVRAYIPGDGKVGDSVLLGEPVRVGNKVSIVFKNLTRDGVDYPISAVALDAETLRPGLADTVDRHIIQRYLKLAIAAAADGYVSALTGSTTTTNSDGSSQTIVESLPDADDQIAIALGTVGQTLLPAFESDFEMPPTIEVYGNKDIVIMFMNSFEIKR